jgi:8-oxo-dGTP pyrophosphatase MutT (NUDIX family)
MSSVAGNAAPASAFT